MPLPLTCSTQQPSSQVLFEAPDPETWRIILMGERQGTSTSNHNPTATSATVQRGPFVFQATAALSQTLESIQTMRKLRQTLTYLDTACDQIPAFYSHMMHLSQTWSILPPHKTPEMATGHPQLMVLWHYGCLCFLAKMDDIEKLAAEDFSDVKTFQSVDTWLGTNRARLATLHCAQILVHSTQLMDLTLLVPRYEMRGNAFFFFFFIG